MVFNVDIKPFLNIYSLGAQLLSSYANFIMSFLKGQVTSHEEVCLSFLLYIKRERGDYQHA